MRLKPPPQRTSLSLSLSRALQGIALNVVLWGADTEASFLGTSWKQSLGFKLHDACFQNYFFSSWSSTPSSKNPNKIDVSGSVGAAKISVKQEHVQKKHVLLLFPQYPQYPPDNTTSGSRCQNMVRHIRALNLGQHVA